MSRAALSEKRAVPALVVDQRDGVEFVVTAFLVSDTVATTKVAPTYSAYAVWLTSVPTGCDPLRHTWSGLFLRQVLGGTVRQ